jgi:hypothetical protein
MDDGSITDRRITADMRPMVLEGGFVIWILRGESRHVNRTRIALVVEEVWKIFVDDFSQKHGLVEHRPAGGHRAGCK